MPNPKHDNPDAQHTAHAPYNFIPLPQKVVTVTVTDIPGHDVYAHYTGYIECTMTTESSTYTRCAQNLDFFKRFADNPQDIRLNKSDRHEYAQFFSLDKTQYPVIPGSSLRGMVRSLVEIAAFGKMQWVTDESLTYRSIRDAYYLEELLLREGKRRVKGKRRPPHHVQLRMQAGYMEYKNGKWFIRPTQKIGGASFARVLIEQVEPIFAKLPKHEKCKNARKIWVRLGQFDYQDVRGGSVRVKFMPVIAPPSESEQEGFQAGVLAKSGYIDKKKYEAVIFPPVQENDILIEIDDMLIESYRTQITDEQKDILGGNGVLNHNQPIFYLMKNQELVFFGHTMMFRLPYPNTPYDLIPEHLRAPQNKKPGNSQIDLAEAIFGYMPDEERKQGRAGRVYFTEAYYQEDKDGIWFKDGDAVVTPQILSGPKPTTFQHYLVQDSSKGHNPNDKKNLAHYGTPTPEETVIRGHKLYWHKGANPNFTEDAQKDPGRNGEGWEKDSQHTQIRPVKAGVTFSFKIYFENLHGYELGALLWVLALPDDCRHKIGMGKPLGLGSAKITPKLVLSDRRKRYKQLFEANSWATGDRDEPDIAQFKQAFEQFILKEMAASERKDDFNDVERIKMLLTMLRWPGPDSGQTRYMTLDDKNKDKYGKSDSDKYKERYVLPDPLHPEGLIQKGQGSQSQPQRSAKAELKQPSSPRRQPAKKGLESRYPVNHTFTMKVEFTWNKKAYQLETKMPTGEPAILDMSRKAAKKLKGQMVELVVVDIKDSVYYLKQV